MGWERKRGKLHELNQLLRGAADTTFLWPAAAAGIPPISATSSRSMRIPGCRETRCGSRREDGSSAEPAQVRFRQAVRCWRAMRCCSRGWRLLCQRAAKARSFNECSRARAESIPMRPPSSTFIRIFSVGSYAGKGIYDVDAFEAALGRPRTGGTLLSHDLFEGAFARAGFVSDIEVVEEFPPVTMSRRTSTPLGSRQLAIAAVDTRPRRCGGRSAGQRHGFAPHRPVENDGQPAAHAGRPPVSPVWSRWLFRPDPLCSGTRSSARPSRCRRRCPCSRPSCQPGPASHFAATGERFVRT